jgi:hypothetical protein
LSYTKQNFTNGTVLNADHLNNIENQIVKNEENILNKADVSHDHNDKYYTESEIDSKFTAKANKTPSLTDDQKAQLVELAGLYTNSNNRKKFKYDGGTLRDSYLGGDSAFIVDGENGTRIKINCGLYCGLLWAGVTPETFIKDINNPSEFTGELSFMDKFDWGYEFIYPNNVACGVVKDDDTPYGLISIIENGEPKIYEQAGSYTTYYNPNSTNSLHQTNFSFMTAADMANELYIGGYEVQMKDVEVGDLLFFTAKSISDGHDDYDEAMRFRNITHVAMVTDVINVDDDNRAKRIWFTESTSMLGDDWPIATLKDTGGDATITRLAYLTNRIVMVGRHPAAFGMLSNITDKRFTQLKKNTNS